MYISQETPEQTERRLREVIRQAELKIYDGVYFFDEFPIDNYTFDSKALAIVRDDKVWSQLVESPDRNVKKELFKIISFHFKDGFDNSGFVGWLATTIKKEIGAGVFVVCGQNSNKGGIFDYWGCPLQVEDEVVKLVKELRG